MIKITSDLCAVFCAISLFACIASFVFSIVGQTYQSRFAWAALSSNGELRMRVTDETDGPSNQQGEWSFDPQSPGLVKKFFPPVSRYGLISGASLEVDDGVIGFASPYWLLIVGFGLPPLVRATIGFRRWSRKRERARNNRCQACGYDLRASAVRCPECGAAVAGAAQPGSQ